MKQRIARRYPALTYRDYRYFLSGWFVSNAGTQMQLVALNWHIYELTRSPYALAILGATRIVPVIIFSLIGGTLGDSHNRKKILYVTQIFQAILGIMLAVITWLGLATPLVLYLMSSAFVALYAIDAPARSAFVPKLVQPEHYGNAVSLNVMGFNISTLAGPAIAGFAIAYWGVGSVYAMNAISFIFLFTALLQIRTSGAIDGTVQKASLSSVREGLSFVRNKTIIWSTMLLDFFSTLFAEATILLPVFAKDILHIGPELLGFLYAAPFVGATIMSLIASWIGKAIHTGRVLLISIVFYAIGTIAFGLSTNYALSLAALVIIGAGDGMSAIIRNIIRQLSTPDHIRARMTSINMIFFTGGPRLGEVEAGIVAGLFGAPASVVLGGIGTLLVVAIMAAAIPTLRNYKEE